MIKISDYVLNCYSYLTYFIHLFLKIRQCDIVTSIIIYVFNISKYIYSLVSFPLFW